MRVAIASLGQRGGRLLGSKLPRPVSRSPRSLAGTLAAGKGQGSQCGCGVAATAVIATAAGACGGCAWGWLLGSSLPPAARRAAAAAAEAVLEAAVSHVGVVSATASGSSDVGR